MRPKLERRTTTDEIVAGVLVRVPEHERQSLVRLDLVGGEQKDAGLLIDSCDKEEGASMSVLCSRDRISELGTRTVEVSQDDSSGVKRLAELGVGETVESQTNDQSSASPISADSQTQRLTQCTGPTIRFGPEQRGPLRDGS